MQEWKLAQEKFKARTAIQVNDTGLLPYQEVLVTFVEKFTVNEEHVLCSSLFVIITGCACRYGPQPQLRLYFGGPGGAGKSQIVSAVRELFGHWLKVTAPTGQATNGVGGSTIHSEVKLMVDAAKLRNTQKGRIHHEYLEAHWQPTFTYVLDEVTFMAAEQYLDMDDNQCPAKGNEDEHYGGVGLLRDFVQLPPPSSYILFNNHLSTPST